MREQVQGNLELDLLCRNMPEAAPVLKEISELIVEAVQNQNSTQRFGINIFPADLVRSRLMQLTSEHIRYVLESLQTHSTCIRNPKKYLLAMLFNAPITMSSKTMLNVRQFTNTPMLTYPRVTTQRHCNRILFIKDGQVFNELHRGTDTRKEFFTKILEVVSVLGGEQSEHM